MNCGSFDSAKIITIQCAGTPEKSQEKSTVYTVSPIQIPQWYTIVVQNPSDPLASRCILRESGLEPPRCMPFWQDILVGIVLDSLKQCSYHSGGATFSGKNHYRVPQIPAQMTRSARFFWQIPPKNLFRLLSRTVDNLWINPKRLTFRSKYVNIMLMI